MTPNFSDDTPFSDETHTDGTQARRRWARATVEEEPPRRAGFRLGGHPRLVRWAAGVVGALVLFVLAAAMILRHDMRAALPENEGLLDGSVGVKGLAAAVTVTRDARGVPTIRAAGLDDLLFAQGYVTASDRLFQMDALRRHGAGELAEILGPSLVEHDRMQRMLQLRAAADRAETALPADQREQLEAYARGVNAFIEGHGSTLPIEFHLLHYAPRPWLPRDSLLIALVMSQDLATEFPTKLNREALAQHLPASLMADLYPVGSWRDEPPMQTPNDLTSPTTPVEQIPLDRTQSRCEEGCGAGKGVIEAGWVGRSWSRAQDLVAAERAMQAAGIGMRGAQGGCEGCRAGSNNWVVAGSHTATGAPLLSNDMHLGLTAPDIWYEAGLHASGAMPLDVAGFTLPGVPFVVVGRNAHVAWGFTNSGADVQDVLVEHVRGTGDGMEYERPDRTWAPVEHHRELIRVRMGDDVTMDAMTVTAPLGNKSIPAPMISELYKSGGRALALAWPIYDATTVTSPLYGVDAATDAASLVAAFAGFGSVSQNMVYADGQHIGYHLVGRIPIRGPAVQRPRATQPFVMPDATPEEDDQDESGGPSAEVVQGRAVLAAYEVRPRRRRGEVRQRVVKPARPKVATTPSVAGGDAAPMVAAPVTPYTIGSPISMVPVDALDANQMWSGYIPYEALPSVLDPSTGMIATANSRIVPNDYAYFIANDWVDAFRVERIDHLLTKAIAKGGGLTAAQMLAIQMDTHSEFDLLLAQRLAYALDHSALTHKDPRLARAANVLRKWDGNMAVNSAAATIVAATRAELWPMLLVPQFQAYAAKQGRKTPARQGKATAEDDALLHLYTWGEKTSALELILQHTPQRWLPKMYANWDDFLATAVGRGLRFEKAPANLSTWVYGPTHPIDIASPVFGSHSPVSTVLGVAMGTGVHPNSGDNTTIKQTGLHFGPSERFTADMADAEATQANVTTGESGNPASAWFLDQFGAYLNGRTYTLPLQRVEVAHRLTMTPE